MLRIVYVTKLGHYGIIELDSHQLGLAEYLRLKGCIVIKIFDGGLNKTIYESPTYGFHKKKLGKKLDSLGFDISLKLKYNPADN